MADKNHNANGNGSGVEAQVSLDQLRAMLDAGKLSPELAAVAKTALDAHDMANGALEFDGIGRVQFKGAGTRPSTPSTTEMVLVLQAERSDKPLSIRLAEHLADYKSAAEDGEEVNTGYPSIRFRGLNLGSTDKSADRNVATIRALARRAQADLDAAELVKAMEAEPAAAEAGK